MQDKAQPRWPRTLGIVGGLGPHAHLAFEAQLLACVGPVGRDQDYPPWILSSLPATPDRTAAILSDGMSPVPWLVASLKNLEGKADFAVVVCNAAHVFLAEASRQVSIPIFHMIRGAIEQISVDVEPGSSIGLLATTGTLCSRIYPDAASEAAPDLRWRSLLDLPGGDQLQDSLVMSSIYGGDGDGGLKAGLTRDPRTGEAYAERLAAAAEHLFEDGCAAVVLGCTEVSLAMSGDARLDTRLVDPMRLAAERCLKIAAGKAPLPST